MYANSTLARLVWGAVAWTFAVVPDLTHAEESDGAGRTRYITVKRFASREDTYLRVRATAVEQQGKLAGNGRLFFHWVSPGKGGDIVSEIDEPVRVDGSLVGDSVRLRIVSPQQLK